VEGGNGEVSLGFWDVRLKRDKKDREKYESPRKNKTYIPRNCTPGPNILQALESSNPHTS
jgi:hypothetical protein